MIKRPLVWPAILALCLLLVGVVAAHKYRTVEYRSERFLMDTLVTIRVYGRDAEHLKKAVNKAFAEMQRIADLTDRFPHSGVPCTSDVCRININSGKAPVKVAPDVYELLSLAKKYHDLTDGALDVTIGPVMDLWGFGGENPHLPNPQSVKSCLSFVDSGKLVLDPVKHSACLVSSGMALDLGAVAKGYATEKAVRVLKENGINKALIDAGGNIRVIGKNAANEFWKIGIKNPRKSGDILAVLSLEDSAAVTSGNYYRYFEEKGKKYNHIIDPRTGYPADKNASVTIVSENAALADILSTAFFVLAQDTVLKMADTMPGIEVFIVTSEGKVIYTQGLEKRLKMLSAEDE